MHWLLAIIGVILGAAVQNNWFFGAAMGFLGGWLLGKQAAIRRELADIRDQVRVLNALRSGGVVAARAAAAQVRADSATASAASQPPSIPPATARPEAVGASSPAASVESTAPESTAAASTPTPTPPQAMPTEPPAPRAWESWEPQTSSPVGQRPVVAPSAVDTEPGWESRLTDAVKRWFTEGNVPVKIGMLVLFFGVGALLKYAVDQGLFSLPIEFRLAAIAGAAIVALGFAWRQRGTRPAFSLSLQGGALGVLLLTVFAAFRLYQVLPAGMAFGLLLVVVAGSAILAVLQDAMALAVLGSIGGFLAPVVISTGGGSHVALFSYYAVLNAAVFGVAWVRPWRVLNLVGFGFTFVVGVAWGHRYYQPEFFRTTEPFLLLFVAFYLAITVFYALRSPGMRRGLVDSTLTFGMPLIAFPLQAALLEGDELGLAYSALGFAAIYAALAYWLWTREGLRTLAISFAALALGFATVSIPLAFDARVTASTWALEGAAVLWLGLRQGLIRQQVAGVALQVLAFGAWLIALDHAPEPTRAVINGQYAGSMLLGVALLFSARRLELALRWAPLQWLGLTVGCMVIAVSGLIEIHHYALSYQRYEWLMIFVAACLTAFAFARQRLGWARLSWPLLLALAISLGLASSCWAELVFSGIRGVAWLTWTAAALFTLYSLRDPQAKGLSLAHVLVLACIAIAVGADFYARLRHDEQLENAWATLAAILPLAAMLWASWRHPQRFSWPLNAVFADYRWRWYLPAMLALGLWWLGSLFHHGGAAPLVYLPVGNPLELGQLGVALLIIRLLQIEGAKTHRPQLWLAAAAGGFAFVSMATLRTVHHWAFLPWNPNLLDAMLAQTSLTVVWSVCGVTAWIVGSRRSSRPIWLAGAVLMGVVLLKLVLIDRQHMGNIPGIVSFLAVGVLLTVVGYFAPSPPKAAHSEPSP